MTVLEIISKKIGTHEGLISSHQTLVPFKTRNKNLSLSKKGQFGLKFVENVGLDCEFIPASWPRLRKSVAFAATDPGLDTI